MGQLSKLTGIEITEGQEPLCNKMCLNCLSCTEGEGGTFNCNNEKVMEAGYKKIMAAVPEGFEIENLTLKPMLLKNPTKKCGNYCPNFDLIHEEVDKFFA